MGSRICSEFVIKLSERKAWEVYSLLSSMMVFAGTFALFVNWSYRLIFFIPAFLILAQMNNVVARVAVVLFVAILWTPIVPYGWGLQNLLSYGLFGVTAFAIAAAVRNRSSMRLEY